jgi:hypothetical protein
MVYSGCAVFVVYVLHDVVFCGHSEPATNEPHSPLDVLIRAHLTLYAQVTKQYTLTKSESNFKDAGKSFPCCGCGVRQSPSALQPQIVHDLFIYLEFI